MRPEDRDPEDCEQEGPGQGDSPESSSNFGKGCSSTCQCRVARGPGVGLPSCPTIFLTTFTPQVFLVLLLRRLGLPLPLTARFCRCGHPLDSCGHHRAACARAGGVLDVEGTRLRAEQDASAARLVDRSYRTSWSTTWIWSICKVLQAPRSCGGWSPLVRAADGVAKESKDVS